MESMSSLAAAEAILSLMQRGGVVMWPLLGLSVIAVTLLLERAWFYVNLHRPGRMTRVRTMAQRLRAGDRAGARRLADTVGGVYGEVVGRLLDERPSEAAAADAVERQRRRLERYLPLLSTIITAAPMLGILGTVLGIIASFEVLGDQTAGRDPSLVGQGIAEALLTTAAGLVVALVTLLPYNLLRGQVERALSQLEVLAAAAMEGRATGTAASDD
jgi:biopolymer transport protein ExbB